MANGRFPVPRALGRHAVDWLLVALLFVGLVVGHLIAQWVSDLVALVFLVVIAVRIVRRLAAR